MKGPPFFQLVNSTIPVAIRDLRPAAEPLLPRLKKEFAPLERRGIIRQVNEPSPNPSTSTSRSHPTGNE